MNDFGQCTASGEIIRLRWDMSAVLFTTAAALPPQLRMDAWSTLRAQTDGTDDFFRLFYQPVWSFLHWVAPAERARRESAVCAHALALFLHLWDDHLCDGQLEPNPARLHLRTLAWQRFEREARSLAPDLFEPRVQQYFGATQGAGPARDLDEYLQNAEHQGAIWYIVPEALGGETLARIVARFYRAWRLVDDAQDAEQDARANLQTAVSLDLDPIGRAASELHEAIAIARCSFPPIAGELEASLAGLRYRAAAARVAEQIF